MKKLYLLFVLLMSFGAFILKAQPIQMTHLNFESGIPSDWIISANVSANTAVAATGSQSCKLKPSTTQVTLTSPTFTRTPACNVRLEFSHIPMLKNLSGGVGGGKVEISIDNGLSWVVLSTSGSSTSPTTYDASYGAGLTSFTGSFRKLDYYKDSDPLVTVPESSLDKSYWRNEVFYLGNSLGTATSFKIRFILPQTPPADQFAGWYLDDIRLTQAATSSNTIRIPQIQSFNSYPNLYNLPNCNDVLVSANLKFLGSSAPSNPDSIYLEYKYNNDATVKRAPMILNTSNNAYEGKIPFNGFDSLTHWRLVVNDNIGNRVTYPYVYDHLSEFVSVRGFVGEFPMATTGLSSQEIMMRTNQNRNLTQMRYRASELNALGYRAGHIESLVYNVTQATANYLMNGFNVYIANVPSNFILDPNNQYSGHFTQVYNAASLMSPQAGWRVLKFIQPYMWDGISDLLIKVCWDNPPGSVGGVTKIECIPAPGASGGVPAATTYQYYQTGVGTTGACFAPFNAGDGAVNFRPNFKFRFVNNCKLKYDIGVTNTLVQPSNYVVQANTPTPIRIRLKNFGTDNLSSANIVYKIDNAANVSAGTWSGVLLNDDSVMYQIPSNISFAPGFRYFKSWTTLLPPQIDYEPKNDTGYFEIISCNGPMSGEYAIGNVSGFTADRKFNSFKEVFKMLQGCGVSGPVTIKILPQGVYSDSLSFPTNIPGISNTNFVKFVSSSSTQQVTIKVDKIFNDVFNLSGAKYFKFENLNFISPDSIFNSTNVIRMNSLTSDIEFKKVRFDKNTLGMNINSFIYVGEANNITIDSCTFDGNATYQVFIKGASSLNLSSGITIKNSQFRNNLENAIYSEYTSNLNIIGNKFDNNRIVSASTVYNVLVQSSNNFNIQKNNIVLNNVNAIGLSNILSSTTRSTIANNKISISNNNDSSSITNISAINMLSGENVLIGYNNIYAKDLGNLVSYGLNLGITGQTISNINVNNNILISDGYGFAVYTRPTSSNSIKFSNNVYWKESTQVSTPSSIMWRLNTVNCTTLTQWQTLLGSQGDTNSYVENPIFTSWNLLNTSNAFLCYKGISITEVIDDFNNTLRPLTGGTCIGALQFDPPPSNIFVKKVWIDKGNFDLASDGTDLYSECGLGNEYIKVIFSNISQNNILQGQMQMWFAIDNLPVTNNQKDTIKFDISPNVDYTYTFRLPYNFSVTNQNKQFKVRAFSVLPVDPIKANDTAKCYVLSRHQLPALAAQNATINYGDSINMSIVSNDSIYWFLKSNDNIPALKSKNYQTQRLYSDTVFYFSRKQEIPLLKISEIQFTKTGSPDGLTPNLPAWVNQNCAIELTNLGNGAINLKNYKIEYIFGAAGDSLNPYTTRSYQFPNYILSANTALVLQYANQISPDSSKTLYIGAGTFLTNSKVGFLLKDTNENVIDALTINGVKFRTSHNVPANVWTGHGKTLPVTTAGIIRNTTNAKDSLNWIPASTNKFMSLGTLDSNLVIAYDNGCFGYKSPYNITVSGIPTVDPGISEVKILGVNKNEVCTLLDEEIQVKITNTGVSPLNSTPIKLNLYELPQTTPLLTVYDTCNITINPNDTITYVLSQTLNLASHLGDKDFKIEAIADLSSDVIRINDTSSLIVKSLMTPVAPSSPGDSIPYGTSTVLSTLTTSNNAIIWYNNPTTYNELGRTNYQTPLLYATDTFYVGEMLQTKDSIIIGTASTLLSALPSPINPSNKYAKEQYLYKNSELTALGIGEGNINSLAFRIAKIVGSFKYENYTIKIGTTTAETLTTWQTNLQEVYYSTTDTLRSTNPADTGWRNYNFSSPFYYDGISNLIIEVCFESKNLSIPYSTQTYFTNAGFNSVIVYRSQLTPVCDWQGSPQISSPNRPNTKFTFEKFGCSSPRTPVVVKVAPPPACDAGILSIENPNTPTVMSGIPIPIQVRIKNYGTDTLVNPDIEWTVNGQLQTPYQYLGSILPNKDTVLTIGNKIFISGINEIIAWTNISCDTVFNDNDSASFSFSSCIGNNTSTTTLTIGGANADYPSIGSAILALEASGVCGNVVFEINPKVGGYNEQIVIPPIIGVSDVSTITFRGNSPDSNDVYIIYDTDTLTDKYIVKFDKTSYINFENLSIRAFSDAAPVVLEINNSNNIKLEKLVLTGIPKSTPHTETTKLLDLYGISDNITINKSRFVSGARGITTNWGANDSTNNLIITNNLFEGYSFDAISAYKVNNFTIKGNKIRQYANQNNAKGIFVNTIYGSLDISNNDIYLKDGINVRTGIEVKRYNGDNFNPGLISNNAVSMTGTKAMSAIAYIGLNLDTVYNVNVFYNTISLFPSLNSPNSRTLSVSMNCSGLRVLNNNLSNSGKGYAYYVLYPGTQVSLSNNNNYYSNGVASIFWTGIKLDIPALQAANGQDAQSVIAYAPFINDSLLELNYPTDIVRRAEPLDDIYSDILGRFRPVSPKPTIGAYEYQFVDYDAGVIEILDPESKRYVEGLPMTVKAKVKNFGLFTMDSVKLTALIKFKRDTTHVIESITETFYLNMPSLTEAEFTFADKLYPPLNFNVFDSISIGVFTSAINDTIQRNDTIYKNFLTIPGYNLQAVNTVQITERCQLFNTPVSVNVKSIGENTVLPGDSIWIGYEVEGRPDLAARELLLLPYNNANPVVDSLQKNEQFTYTFNKKANFYPLGLNDTTWKVRSYVYLRKDNVRINDTTSNITVTARVSPPPPIPRDTVIHYGTWAKPWATQADSYAIKWFKDSTDAAPFYTHNNYGISTQYSTTQLFVDSIFYLRVNQTGGFACNSLYVPLKVNLYPRSNVDASMVGFDNQGVVYPPKTGFVYMSFNEDPDFFDTIKVRLTNFGTQPLSNFQVSYGIRTADTGAYQIVTETCTDIIPRDSSYVYKFNTLANLHDITKTYRIRTWVNAPGDAAVQNDTSAVWMIKPKNGNTVYCNTVATLANTLDITKVQIGNLDHSSNATGVKYTDFTKTVSPVKLFKGVPDSLYVMSEKPSSMLTGAPAIEGWVRAFIDWNRNGMFEDDELVMSQRVISGSFSKGKIEVPTTALNGQTRMRITLWQMRDSTYFDGCTPPIAGEVEDYLVTVVNPQDYDAELMKFISPTALLVNPVNDVTVVLRNTGVQPLTSATITWQTNDDPIQVYTWAGNLQSGDREIITLANLNLNLGQTRFIAYVDALNDVAHSNDTIRIDSYIFKTYKIPYTTTFDEANGQHNDDFYPLNINPNLPTNCWQFGTPDSMNNVIKGAYSAPNCWKTQLSGQYPANNESILYSPKFDIGIIKPDTLKFMLRRSLSFGASMYVEYLSWNRTWERLGKKNDKYGVNWYNGDSNRFESTLNWTEVQYSLDHLLYNMGNEVQFRFVFKSGTNQNDGFAIDDFILERGLGAQDVGAVSVQTTPSITPNFGSYYYPRVRIRNYGKDLVDNFDICYKAQDMFIPICEEIHNAQLGMGDTMTYIFKQGKYVNVELENPFQLCAFTRLNPTDIYNDNDTACNNIVIGPLEKDVALIEIITPDENVVANDQIEVAILVRNLGFQSVSSLPVYYTVDGTTIYGDTIIFTPDLYYSESYVYKFKHKFKSFFGATNLKVWTGLVGDFYHDNDTLYKRINGTTSTLDIEAREILVDDFNPTNIGVQLTISNNSSMSVDSIQVGYYINGDINTAVVENYRLDNALPAGSLGYHYFTTTLSRANAPYTSICAFVNVPDDNNPTNDSTCTIRMGYHDAIADTVFIEHTSSTQARVQLRARNIGTLGGPSIVKAYLVVDGNWSSPIQQDFNWTYDEPNPKYINFMTFTQTIPRKDNKNYNVIGFIKYEDDYNLSNDTTYVWKVVGLIGLEDEVEVKDEFTLDQNIPNPFENNTKIPFYLPNSGTVRFFIMDNLGKLIYSENKEYPQGSNSIEFNAQNLPQGIYYYTMEFDGQRKSKKMIIAK